MGITALNSGFSFPDIQRLMAYRPDKASKEAEPTPSQGGQELEMTGLLPTFSVTPPNGICFYSLPGSYSWRGRQDGINVVRYQVVCCSMSCVRKKLSLKIAGWFPCSLWNGVSLCGIIILNRDQPFSKGCSLKKGACEGISESLVNPCEGFQNWCFSKVWTLKWGKEHPFKEACLLLPPFAKNLSSKLGWFHFLTRRVCAVHV